jgi:hypothetical protein
MPGKLRQTGTTLEKHACVGLKLYERPNKGSKHCVNCNCAFKFIGSEHVATAAGQRATLTLCSTRQVSLVVVSIAPPYNNIPSRLYQYRQYGTNIYHVSGHYSRSGEGRAIDAVAKCSLYSFAVCLPLTDKPWNRAIRLYWYISMTMAYYDQCMLALVSFDDGLWSFSYPHRSTLWSSFCSPVAAVEIQ